jgi:hypothetical protein
MIALATLAAAALIAGLAAQNTRHRSHLFSMLGAMTWFVQVAALVQ